MSISGVRTAWVAFCGQSNGSSHDEFAQIHVQLEKALQSLQLLARYDPKDELSSMKRAGCAEIVRASLAKRMLERLGAMWGRFPHREPEVTLSWPPSNPVLGPVLEPLEAEKGGSQPRYLQSVADPSAPRAACATAFELLIALQEIAFLVRLLLGYMGEIEGSWVQSFDTQQQVHAAERDRWMRINEVLAHGNILLRQLLGETWRGAAAEVIVTVRASEALQAVRVAFQGPTPLEEAHRGEWGNEDDRLLFDQELQNRVIRRSDDARIPCEAARRFGLVPPFDQWHAEALARYEKRRCPPNAQAEVLLNAWSRWVGAIGLDHMIPRGLARIAARYLAGPVVGSASSSSALHRDPVLLEAWLWRVLLSGAPTGEVKIPPDPWELDPQDAWPGMTLSERQDMGGYSRFSHITLRGDPPRGMEGIVLAVVPHTTRAGRLDAMLRMRESSEGQPSLASIALSQEANDSQAMSMHPSGIWFSRRAGEPLERVLRDLGDPSDIQISLRISLEDLMRSWTSKQSMPQDLSLQNWGVYGGEIAVHYAEQMVPYDPHLLQPWLKWLMEHWTPKDYMGLISLLRWDLLWETRALLLAAYESIKGFFTPQDATAWRESSLSQTWSQSTTPQIEEWINTVCPTVGPQVHPLLARIFQRITNAYQCGAQEVEVSQPLLSRPPTDQERLRPIWAELGKIILKRLPFLGPLEEMPPWFEDLILFEYLQDNPLPLRVPMEMVVHVWQELHSEGNSKPIETSQIEMRLAVLGAVDPGQRICMGRLLRQLMLCRQEEQGQAVEWTQILIALKGSTPHLQWLRDQLMQEGLSQSSISLLLRLVGDVMGQPTAQSKR